MHSRKKAVKINKLENELLLCERNCTCSKHMPLIIYKSEGTHEVQAEFCLTVCIILNFSPKHAKIFVIFF